MENRKLERPMVEITSVGRLYASSMDRNLKNDTSLSHKVLSSCVLFPLLKEGSVPSGL